MKKQINFGVALTHSFGADLKVPTAEAADTQHLLILTWAHRIEELGAEQLS